MIRQIFLGALLWSSQATNAQEVDRPWLMMVSTKSTDTHRDAQFNEWYDQIDIPDVLQVPGYKRARRGVRVELPQLPRADAADDNTYVTLYDILSPNIDRTMIDMLMASRKMEAVGRSNEVSADSAEQVASLHAAARAKLRQDGRLSDLFVERGTALYLGINDVYAH